MKLVIDIPEKTYEELKTRNVINVGETFSQKLIKYIRNGIPLPEGHGRLIDADNLTEEIFVIDAYSEESVKEQINDAPTVIPADKEIKNVTGGSIRRNVKKVR